MAAKKKNKLTIKISIFVGNVAVKGLTEISRLKTVEELKTSTEKTKGAMDGQN